MKRILVSPGCHPSGLKLLQENGCSLIRLDDTSDESIIAGIREAEAVLLRIQRRPLTEKILSEAGKLRIISRYGVGFDNVDVAYLSSRKIPMALAVDADIGISVAEHALMMLLMLFRDVMPKDRELRKGNYAVRDQILAAEARGKKILIMGYGRIGRRFGMLCTALGMQIYVYDPFIGRNALAENEQQVSDFRTVLHEMDAVSLHMPLTAETAFLLGPGEIASMKSSAVIINTARGGLLDETALYEALKAGQLRGAGIDVFSSEPPSPDNPLFQLSNCLVTPHCAPLTEDCLIRTSTQAAQNILDCFSGTLQPRVLANRKELGL